MNGRAIVLLSGGVDSATTLAIAKRDGFDVIALSFDYGQRHIAELWAASTLASKLGVIEHRIMKLHLRTLGGSALTDNNIDVPKNRTAEEMASGIPVTYVPARNTIFLAHALALAEVTRASAIYIGVNAVDYSGYPDCRPEYVDAFQNLARLATRSGVEGRPVEIRAPLVWMSKAKIIQTGESLGVPYWHTFSCYSPVGSEREPFACGRCDSCVIRREAFVAAQVPDPTRYTTRYAP